MTSGGNRSGDAPGSARAPGPTLREQLLADPTPPPWPLLIESPVFLGDADVPYSNYTSVDQFRAEFDLVAYVAVGVPRRSSRRDR